MIIYVYDILHRCIIYKQVVKMAQPYPKFQPFRDPKTPRFCSGAFNCSCVAPTTWPICPSRSGLSRPRKARSRCGSQRRPKDQKKRLRSREPNGSVSKPCTPGEHQNSW